MRKHWARWLIAALAALSIVSATIDSAGQSASQPSHTERVIADPGGGIGGDGG